MPGSLRCDERLKVEDVDKPGFDELRFGQGRGYTEDRLFGEKHVSLGHRMDVSREPECGQIVDQAGTKSSARAKRFEIVRREAKIFEKAEGLLQPRRQQKAAVRG